MRVHDAIIAVLVAFLFILGGCHGGMQHPLGRIMGTYVSHPGEGQKGFYRRELQCRWETCFDLAQTILRDNLGVTVFFADETRKQISAMHFHRIYESCIDTTEVYVSFRPTSEGRTNVDVACGNSHLAEFVSIRIYDALEKHLKGSD